MIYSLAKVKVGNTARFPSIRLVIQGLIVISARDKHYSDWMYIWNELSLPAGKATGYDIMTGNGGAGAGGSASSGGSGLAAASALTTVYVPLEFWFCRNVGLALPLIALQYHECKINIDFESLANLSRGSVAATGEIASASLWVDYVYLDTDERRRFAQLSHEYLIEQLQFTGDEVVTGTSTRVKLNLNHPVKELVWVVQADAVALLGASNDWTNYTTATGTAGVNPVSPPGTTGTNLQLNGQDRFAPRDGNYFSLVQPYQHHENVPVGPGGGSSGINVYSFALKPEEHQPSGTLNFSRIDTAVLNLQTPLLASGATAKCKIFAVNYNVLRVMSGMGGLKHQN